MKKTSVFLFLAILVLGSALYVTKKYQSEESLKSSKSSSRSSHYTADANDGAPDIRVNIQNESSNAESYLGEGGSAADQRILKEIGNMLTKSYGKMNVNLHIQDGNVTISGVVKSTNDILDIENAILRIKGVKSVHNKLNALNSPVPAKSKYSR